MISLSSPPSSSLFDLIISPYSNPIVETTTKAMFRPKPDPATRAPSPFGTRSSSSYSQGNNDGPLLASLKRSVADGKANDLSLLFVYIDPQLSPSLYFSGEYSDFTIKCQEDEYQVHKVVICPRSPWFTRKLCNDSEVYFAPLHRILPRGCPES